MKEVDAEKDVTDGSGVKQMNIGEVKVCEGL
jgi:hypothetical protein